MTGCTKRGFENAVFLAVFCARKSAVRWLTRLADGLPGATVAQIGLIKGGGYDELGIREWVQFEGGSESDFRVEWTETGV